MFCAAGLLVLLAVWPKYAQRQGRLELQYRAEQEVTRRRFEGEAVARPVGQEGDARPPESGDLIIRLWPIAVVLAPLLTFSAFMFWRGRRSPLAESNGPCAGDSP